MENQVDLYRQIAAHFQTMTGIAPFRGPGTESVDKTRLPEMIELCKHCRDLEDQAVNGIKAELEMQEC